MFLLEINKARNTLKIIYTFLNTRDRTLTKDENSNYVMNVLMVHSVECLLNKIFLNVNYNLKMII